LNDKFHAFLKKDKAPFDFKRLHYIKRVEDSKALNLHKSPCVIISASGMADAGRVKHHIKHVIGDRRNTILLVGYCEPNSLGGKLMRGNKEVTMFGDLFFVNAEIEVMRSMSAHGDYEDLCQFIACQDKTKVKKVFLVHGEEKAASALQKSLSDHFNMQVHVPVQKQQFTL